MNRRTWLAAAGVTAAVTVGVVAVQLGGGSSWSPDDEGRQDAGQASPAEMLAEFEAGEPLGEMDAAAVELAEGATAGGAEAEAACAAAVDRLDALGTPDRLAEIAGGVRHPEISEAALEQQAGVMSVLAACRGEAPVPVTDAAAELAESNAALDGLLSDLAEGGDG